MRISVVADVRKALDDIDRVSLKSVPRAAAAAITRAAKSARSVAIDELQQVIGGKVLKRTVAKSVTLTSVRGSNRKVDGARIGIKKVGIALGTFPCAQTATGVTVTLPTGALHIPGAFLGRVGKSQKSARGHRGVFLRARNATHRGTLRSVKRGKNKGKTYKPALPIRELFTSAGQTKAIEQRVVPKQNARFLERWPVEFERALKQFERGVR